MTHIEIKFLCFMYDHIQVIQTCRHRLKYSQNKEKNILINKERLPG